MKSAQQDLPGFVDDKAVVTAVATSSFSGLPSPSRRFADLTTTKRSTAFSTALCCVRCAHISVLAVLGSDLERPPATAGPRASRTLSSGWGTRWMWNRRVGCRPMTTRTMLASTSLSGCRPQTGGLTSLLESRSALCAIRGRTRQLSFRPRPRVGEADGLLLGANPSRFSRCRSRGYLRLRASPRSEGS